MTGFYFRTLNKYRAGIVYLAAVIVVFLMLGACTGTKKMQTAQATTDFGDQTIVCRRRAPTGSRLKKNICKTVAQWEREDQVKRGTAEDLQQGAEQSQRTWVDLETGTFPGASVPR